MATIEQLTQHALTGLIRQRREGSAPKFLRVHFPDLSPDEAEKLARFASPDRQLAVQKLMKELSDHVKEMKADEADGFLHETFPFLGQDERDALRSSLNSEIPRPPYDPIDDDALFAVYILMDQTLDRLAFEQEEGRTRYTLERFSALSPTEIDLLADPGVARGDMGVDKIIHTLVDQAQEMNIAEVKGMISEKFPSLRPADQAKMIGEISSHIPARPPRKLKGFDV